MSIYSPIFPPGTKPAHPGLYLTSYSKCLESIGLHRWDGKNWYDASGKGGSYRLVGLSHGQSRYWRGLAVPQQGAETPCF